MSTRESILAAMATALSGLASGRVYRTRQEQLSTLPAIVIEPLQDSATEYALGRADRRLTVQVSVFAKGDIPDSAADSTISSAWSALFAAPTLGLGDGVQLMPDHELSWNFDDYDYAQAVLRVTYLYTTPIGSM